MAEVNNNSEPVIVVSDLYKSFGEKHVLQGVNLTLHQQENLAVLGRSGTGKSVLIKIIVRLLKQDTGTINVLGQQVENLNEKDLMALRLKIGFSFQNSALYDSMTVGENLKFPLVRNVKNLKKRDIDDQVEQVLDAVGLSETIDQWPSELSGGQKKRIGIARTLILRPQIMLYDEPTAGLDPITCVEINTLIREVREKYHTSSIIITHDLSCARETSDRLAMLFDGKFINQGTFEEVFASKDQRIQDFYNYNFIK